jgi:hypothetical protein
LFADVYFYVCQRTLLAFTINYDTASKRVALIFPQKREKKKRRHVSDRLSFGPRAKHAVSDKTMMAKQGGVGSSNPLLWQAVLCCMDDGSLGSLRALGILLQPVDLMGESSIFRR